MARCLITRRSPRTGMAASVRVICCDACSRPCCRDACEKVWSGGEAFAVDAGLIRADANRQNGIEGEKGLPAEASGRAVEEYLAVLDDAAFGGATEVTPNLSHRLIRRRAGP